MECGSFKHSVRTTGITMSITKIFVINVPFLLHQKTKIWIATVKCTASFLPPACPTHYLSKRSRDQNYPRRQVLTFVLSPSFEIILQDDIDVLIHACAEVVGKGWWMPQLTVGCVPCTNRPSVKCLPFSSAPQAVGALSTLILRTL